MKALMHSGPALFLFFACALATYGGCADDTNDPGSPSADGARSGGFQTRGDAQSPPTASDGLSGPEDTLEGTPSEEVGPDSQPAMTCGDGLCGVGESTANCPTDCGTGACDDGVCDPGEDADNCPADCSVCPDDLCTGDETTVACPQDCGSVCQDGACNGNETSINCPNDCGTVCGDGACNGTESSVDCADDCGTQCGDTICSDGETTSSCAEDCGSSCGDGTCNGSESTVNCPPDCGTACGDGTCADSETSANCPGDCGEAIAANDSEFVSQSVPTEVTAGASFDAQLTFRNVGQNSWSLDSMHFLGSTNPMDNLTWSTNRMWMAPNVVVPTTDTYTFTKTLTAPDEPGSYIFQWQMLQDAVEWFGAMSTAVNIEVVASSAPDSPPGPPDLSQVVWLHTNVSNWPETANLSSVTVDGDSVCLQYDKKGSWPVVTLLFNPQDPVDVVANPWVFIYQDGTWYAGTWEWLKPNQTCKNKAAVAGDHIKAAPFAQNSGWVPTSGQVFYFMVSGLARHSDYTNVQERSNLVEVVWP